MKAPILHPVSRMRLVAVLLMSLPSLVATACFAHGHGALPAAALLAVLAAAIGVGAVGSYLALSPAGSRKVQAQSLPTAAVLASSSRI